MQSLFNPIMSLLAAKDIQKNNSRRQPQLAQKSFNRTPDILQIQQEGIVTEQ